MGKYDFGIDLNNENTTYTKLIKLTGKKKKVLEIGCYTGSMSKYLVDNGCHVTGVEIDESAAQQAQSVCQVFYPGNIEEENTLRRIEGFFEVIIFADVLEHLVCPEKILQKIKPLLSPDGYILVSFPNIAHWSIRRRLLFGKFDYQEVGILDRTHLHFYTLDSFQQLIRESGYQMVEWYSIPNYNWFDHTFFWAKPFYKHHHTRNLLNKLDQFLSRYIPKMFGYQFIVKLKRLK